MSNTDNNNTSSDAGDNEDQHETEAEKQIDFHEAAVLDENGKPIPITEEMVQKACEELEKSRESASED